MFKESAAAIVEDYALPVDADEFGDAIMPLYQERCNQAKALPGVNQIIRHLHNHGVPLALASNSIKKHIEMKISHQQGWKDMFSVILGGDEVNSRKPSPDIFLEAANIDTSNCLVIEDSPLQIQGIFKVAVSIGWDFSSGTNRRIILPRLLGHINNYDSREKFQTMFVGYVRELSCKEDTPVSLILCEEDENIARAALDLPVFSSHINSPLQAEEAFNNEAFCNS